MEENSNGKTKLAPSLPSNYVSLNDLKKRWNERKQKEEEERRRKQETGGQGRIEEEEEEDLKKRRNDSKKKESGEVEKEKSVAIVSERGDCEVPRDDGLGNKKKKRNKGKSRKRYDSRKTRNVGVEECGAEIDTPVRDVIRVFREEGGEEAKGNGASEKAVRNDSMVIGTQFEDVVSKRKKTRRDGKKKDQAVEENVKCDTENKTPVVRVYRKKGEEAKGNAPYEEPVTAKESQFEKLSMERGETKDMKEQSRPGNYVKRKEETQDVVAVEKNVVECGTQNKAPVKNVVRVYRVKGEQAKGNGPREQAVMGMEIQFENLSMERGETKDFKEQTRSGKIGKRKKKNQDVVAVEENVVECESIVTEKKTPVKDVIRVYREKRGDKAKGNGSREEANAAIETQSEYLSVKIKDSKTEKRPKQRRDLRSERVRMDAATMVWVKKGQNEIDGIGSGVKSFNA